MSAADSGRRLRVDWPACRAHGLCHELLPDLIRLDEWGYPVLAAPPGGVSGEVPKERVAEARAAARSCPRLALHLT